MIKSLGWTEHSKEIEKGIGFNIHLTLVISFLVTVCRTDVGIRQWYKFWCSSPTVYNTSYISDYTGWLGKTQESEESIKYNFQLTSTYSLSYS